MINYRKDITVLILSHNRQHCLEAVLPYWNKHSFKTLVIDQSPKPLDKVQDFENVRYFYLDEPFAQRCLLASELMSTKYSIIVSDDELYLPAGLEAMWSKLEENKKLVSVGAVALAIWKYGPQTCGAWPYKKTFRYVNDGETPIERVMTHTGNGVKPVTSFFTSNLSRTEHVKYCLDLYGKSRSIATEAISILTICAGGRSEFIDSLFWIRNWNEVPRSHKGWNRDLMIHDWWRANKDRDEGRKFRQELMEVYSRIGTLESFDIVWELILMASEKSQPSILRSNYRVPRFLQPLAGYTKWGIKSLAKRGNLPPDYLEVLKSMSCEGVKFNMDEVDEAINIVERLRPYKNWKRT